MHSRSPAHGISPQDIYLKCQGSALALPQRYLSADLDLQQLLLRSLRASPTSSQHQYCMHTARSSRFELIIFTLDYLHMRLSGTVPKLNLSGSTLTRLDVSASHH